MSDVGMLTVAWCNFQVSNYIHDSAPSFTASSSRMPLRSVRMCVHSPQGNEPGHKDDIHLAVTHDA